MTRLLSAEKARRFFAYDADTGGLAWKIKPGRSIRVGDPAGTEHKGRTTVGIDRRMYPIGRLIWLIAYGVWPVGVVDHINGNPLDNRLANLRDVPQRVNVENRRKPTSRNKSGLLGVSWHAGNQAWRATIVARGRQRTIGYFSDPIAAHDAYVSAKREIHTGSTI